MRVEQAGSIADIHGPFSSYSNVRTGKQLGSMAATSEFEAKRIVDRERGWRKASVFVFHLPSASQKAEIEGLRSEDGGGEELKNSRTGGGVG